MDYRCFCDNKGCGKEMRPVVDKTTLEAYCTECDKPVNNIAIFMRRQMAANGQIRKTERNRIPWAVKCHECSKESPPELSKDNKLVCFFCKKELTKLSKPFAEMIMRNLFSKKRADGE